MKTMRFFANPCDGVVTCFEIVCQFNKRRDKKLDISLLLRHPPTYLITCLLTYVLTYLPACLEAAWSCHIKKKGEENFSAKENFNEKL